MSLRRAVSPLADVCNRLLRFDIPHIPADTRPYFRDVYDHIVRLNETPEYLITLDTTPGLLTGMSLTGVRGGAVPVVFTPDASFTASDMAGVIINAINFSPSIGWFLVDNFELSGILDVSNLKAGGDSATLFSALVEPSFHLPINRSMFGFIMKSYAPPAPGLAVAHEPGRVERGP